MKKHWFLVGMVLALGLLTAPLYASPPDPGGGAIVVGKAPVPSLTIPDLGKEVVKALAVTACVALLVGVSLVMAAPFVVPVVERMGQVVPERYDKIGKAKNNCNSNPADNIRFNAKRTKSPVLKRQSSASI
jgi:hypothetical protein